MNRKEKKLPLLHLIKEKLDINSQIMVYSDKRKSNITRRIKICSSTYKPTSKQISDLDKALIDYGYKIHSHKVYDSTSTSYGGAGRIHPTYVINFTDL